MAKPDKTAPSGAHEDVRDVESVKPLLYSVAQTCALLGLSQSSIYVLISKGELQTVRFGGIDSLRITHASIMRLLEAGKDRKPRAHYQKRGKAARKRVKAEKASAS
jgi:excisionase family DNA binding protein